MERYKHTYVPSAICVVFDLTDPSSLDSADKWINEAVEANMATNSNNPPVRFLIGTKKDLLVTELQSLEPIT